MKELIDLPDDVLREEWITKAHGDRGRVGPGPHYVVPAPGENPVKAPGLRRGA